MKIYLDCRDVLDNYIYDVMSDSFLQLFSNEALWKSDKDKKPQHDGFTDILIAEEIPVDEIKFYIEGSFQKITVNAYERDLHARQKCVEHYKILSENKVICWICGFNFGEFYGDRMLDKIHVHHKIPLSEIKGEYQVDPINDMVPICPNCHYAIHFLNFTPELLKMEVEKRRSPSSTHISTN